MVRPTGHGLGEAGDYDRQGAAIAELSPDGSLFDGVHAHKALTAANVKVRLHRARMYLRDRLKDYFDDEREM